MSWWSKNVTHKVSKAAKKVGFRNMFDPTDAFKQMFDPNRKGGLAGLGQQYLNDFKDWYDGTAAMRKQNRLMRENWELENAYNTPEAQMQRFKEAGLNPNLIYGQSNTAGSIGTPTAPDSGGEQLGRLVSTIMAFYQIGNLIAQNKNLGAQNTLIRSQADYTSAQAERYRYETGWLKDHNTTSFEPTSIRAGKSLFDQFGGIVADKLGSVYGSLTTDVPSVTLIRSRFPSQAEFDNVVGYYRQRGYKVYMDFKTPPLKGSLRRRGDRR